MAWQWPSLGLSPDVRPASDPEPRLGRKAEGGHRRELAALGGLHTRVLLMGANHQPGMSVCTGPLMPMSGEFKWTGPGGETSGCYKWPTSLLTPLSLTLHILHRPIFDPREANGAASPASRFCMVWSNLAALCAHVSMFPPSHRGHNSLPALPLSHPIMYCSASTENTSFSQHFPQWQLFFPCSPLTKRIWSF